MRILSKGSLLTVGLVAAGLPAYAGRFFSEGECALIVASRRTMEEVRLFHRNNPDIQIDDVYRAENGWFAISSRLVPDSRRQNELTWRKRNGMIPQDSYCSDGETYVARVGSSLSNTSTSSSDYAPGSTHPSAEFDARPMTWNEKRFLQAALALSGYYHGLLDGEWGSGSQSALERFSFDYSREKPRNEHAAILVARFVNEWVDGGWGFRYFPEHNISVLVPKGRISKFDHEGTYRGYEDPATGVYFGLNRYGFYGMQDLHQSILSDAEYGSEPYTLRKDQHWVTSVSRKENETYVWSRFWPEMLKWTAIMIVSEKNSLSGYTALMTSSLEMGSSPAPLDISDHGHLNTVFTQAAIAAQEPRRSAPDTGAGPSSAPPRVSSMPAPAGDPEAPSPGSAPVRGTGTGFFVGDDGLVLTNNHVIEGCGSVSIEGRPAKVVSRDSVFDLAAVKPSSPLSPARSLVFAENDPGLNSDITVAGYPLQDILGGFNITRGSVSSLSGIDGDKKVIQITAPVQPGNSGGPVVNSDGDIVGVVVSKLDSTYMLENVGDVPQNINFAVRGDMAKYFLVSNGHSITERGDIPGRERTPQSPEELGTLLGDATVLVECR